MRDDGLESSITLKEEDKGGGGENQHSKIFVEQAEEAEEVLQSCVDKESKESTKSEPALGQNTTSNHHAIPTDDLYSSFEMGRVSEDDEGLLYSGNFGEQMVSDETSNKQQQSLEEEANMVDTSINDSVDFLTDHQTCTKGNIGSPHGEDVPGAYLVRFLCSKFLLAGHSGSLLGDRSVRVSAKVLALNCLTKVLVWLPEMMEETLFIYEEQVAVVDLVQKVWDVSRYTSHGDPSVCAAAASMLGHYLRSAALNASHDLDTIGVTPSYSANNEQQLQSQPSISEVNSPVSAEAIIDILKEVCQFTILFALSF